MKLIDSGKNTIFLKLDKNYSVKRDLYESMKKNKPVPKDINGKKKKKRKNKTNV